MTSFCKATVLDEIRHSAIGRVCPPVAPDFTSGFLMLAHCEWVLTIDEALYTSVGAGNGSDFRRGGELAARFRKDLGMEEHEIVDRMPSDACFSHALVLNDLMRVRDAIPERFPGIEVDKEQYYVGCLNDYVKAARHGARRDEDVAELLGALDREPDEVQAFVKGTRVYGVATAPGGVKEKVKASVASLTAPAPPPDFPTVFDAMAWDAANPREPAVNSFVELKYDRETMGGGKPRLREVREVLSSPPAPSKLGSRLRGLLSGAGRRS